MVKELKSDVDRSNMPDVLLIINPYSEASPFDPDQTVPTEAVTAKHSLKILWSHQSGKSNEDSIQEDV